MHARFWVLVLMSGLTAAGETLPNGIPLPVLPSPRPVDVPKTEEIPPI